LYLICSLRYSTSLFYSHYFYQRIHSGNQYLLFNENEEIGIIDKKLYHRFFNFYLSLWRFNYWVHRL
jgi:hypothetical protein